VAASLNNLANLYQVQGKYAEAEPLHQQALRIKEKALGPNHPDVATSLSNLAALYAYHGKNAEAISLWQRSLRIREQAFGPEHPLVGVSLRNLAVLYRDQGKYSDAESFVQRSLRIDEKFYGAKHHEVASDLFNLADLYRDQRKYAEAERLYQRSLQIREEVLGKDHPQVADSLERLANLYGDQGKYADAEPLSNRAIAILDRAGVGPSARFFGYLARARIRWNLEHQREAIADLDKALDLAEQERTQFSGAERDRALGFARFTNAYEQMITWQLELGSIAEAWTALERSRARSLVDQMNQRGIDLTAGLSPAQAVAIHNRDTEIQVAIAGLQKQLEAVSKAFENRKGTGQL
jgi:tetratricopeptide (TPR) repeat protein